MTEPVTREHLVERLAEVSHATWVLQAVHDYGGTFADPTDRERARIGSPEWESDVVRARELLAAALGGDAARPSPGTTASVRRARSRSSNASGSGPDFVYGFCG